MKPLVNRISLSIVATLTCSRFVFWTSRVRFSARELAMTSEDFVIFLSSSKQMLRCYLKLYRDCIHINSIIPCYITYGADKELLNKLTQ